MSSSPFKPLLFQGQNHGFFFENEHAYFVFGNGSLNREKLNDVFPQAQFCFLKQVHGRQVVRASAENSVEADGHVTDQHRLALVSITADCVPILLQNHHEVGALHAGWRGVAQNIVSASKGAFKNPPHIAAIGPHIRQQSFEVGLDVVDQLLKALPVGAPPSPLIKDHSDPNKKYFNLLDLVKAQLYESFPEIAIIDTGEDTVTNLAFHSFRRGKDKAQRQYSFVMLKNPKPV